MVDKSEKFRWLVCLGYAARGVVYALIGYLALSRPGGESGPEGAFGYLHDMPLGSALLYVSAIGLLGYALYRFSSLLFDVESHGSDARGIAYRIGHGASGVAHVVLAYTAFQFAQGEPQSGGGTEQAAGTVLSVSFGSIVLGVIGLGFMVAAIMQAKQAITRSFMREMSSHTPAAVEYLGRAGLAARAVVFAVIGWSLVQSAWLARTARVKTLGEAITSLAGNDTLYTLVAIGLLLFGLFSLLSARYRIVPDLARSDLRPALH